MANINRREFLKTNAAATFSLALAGTGIGKAESPANYKDIRLGIVGMGNRGKALLRTLLTIRGIKITALCDIDKEKLAFAQEMVVKAGQRKPEGYSKNEYVFKQLMNRDDLDAVIITTPWEWHTPMAVYGMKAGKYVGVEVPATQTVEDCWELVKTYEQTKVPCMMMENWSFRRDNLAAVSYTHLTLPTN